MRKFALITGAGRGIGFETALKLCEDFEYTVVAISRDQHKLSQLETIAPAGRMICIPFDIASFPSSLPSLLKTHKVTHLDVLINNAGFLVNKPIEKISDEELTESFKVNAMAPFVLIRELLPLLKKSGNAHIVNISSMGGFQGAAKFKGLSAYSSSKAALVCLTECLALELKDDAVSCNCLCLGAVQTEMLETAFPGYKAPLSAGRMAEYIARFADEAHRFMNGKIIPLALSTP